MRKPKKMDGRSLLLVGTGYNNVVEVGIASDKYMRVKHIDLGPADVRKLIKRLEAWMSRTEAKK